MGNWLSLVEPAPHLMAQIIIRGCEGYHKYEAPVYTYQIAVLDTEIPQADHTRSSTQLQLSHYNEWE